jgi:hypothetical protein
MRGLQDQLEVFIITDPEHPAKKYTAETLEYLNIRTEERGVKAKKVTHFLCLKSNVSVIRALEFPYSHICSCVWDASGRAGNATETLFNIDPPNLKTHYLHLHLHNSCFIKIGDESLTHSQRGIDICCKGCQGMSVYCIH